MEPHDARLSNEHLRALGRVTANFEAQSMYVRMLAVALIGGDQEVGHIALASLSSRQLAEVLESLARHRLKEIGAGDVEVNQVSEWVKALRASEELRDTILHSAWGVDSTGTVSRLKIPRPKGKLFRLTDTPYGVADVNGAADRIGQATQELLDTLMEGSLARYVAGGLSIGPTGGRL